MRRKGTWKGNKAKQAFRKAALGLNCSLCGESLTTLEPHSPMQITIDHEVPLSAGGEDVLANWCPVHRVCNEAKSALLPELLPLWKEVKEAGEGLRCECSSSGTYIPSSLVGHLATHHQLSGLSIVLWVEVSVRKAWRKAKGL